MVRGDVFRFKTPKGMGREQQGDRFCVIVQADELLPRSVVLAAPTSRSAAPGSFRPEVEIGSATTRVLIEHLSAVDLSRLGKLAGHLTRDEMSDIDLALATVLGLS